MIDVPQNYTALMLDDDHYFEVSVTFGNITPATGDTPKSSEFREGALISVKTEQKMFSGDTPTVGGVIASELTLSMFNPSISIPRQQKIRLWVRVCTDESHSDWIPNGVFYIDTREITQDDDDRDILTIHAYDGILKTEALYPSTSHAWPMYADEVAEEIAQTIGVDIDDRTAALFNQHEYQISVPASLSMREVLSNIASMYGGNWVMTYEGELLLIPLGGIPKDTSLLVDEYGNIISFGEDAISLVEL